MPNREMTMDLVNHLILVLRRMEAGGPTAREGAVMLNRIEWDLRRMGTIGKTPRGSCGVCCRVVGIHGHVETCLVGQALEDLRHWKGVVDLAARGN